MQAGLDVKRGFAKGLLKALLAGAALGLAGVVAGALFLIVRADPVSAATYGPQEVKVFATSGVVRLAFTPKPDTEFSVYRHTYEDGRSVSRIAWVRTDANGRIIPSSVVPDGAWTDHDELFPGMLVFSDRQVEDFKEYYYFVTDGPFTGRLQDYKVIAAYPPTPSRHGSYNENNASCHTCHGLHSSSHPKLLKGPTIEDLCMTCHDGTGSRYDEANGRVRVSDSWNTYASAPAGPFGKHLSAMAQTEATSVHDVRGRVMYEAPGSGVTSPAGTWKEEFGCTSCHDAHDKFNNFRALRGVINGAQARVRAFTAVNWTSPDRSDAVSVTQYIYGVNDFCVTCHVYYGDPRLGSVDKTAPGVPGSHRHPVGISPASYADVRYESMSWEPAAASGAGAGSGQGAGGGLPFEDSRPLTTTLPLEGTYSGADYNKNMIICLTCHMAHGTTRNGTEAVANLNGDANGTAAGFLDPATGYTGAGQALAGTVGSTVLKRGANSAICQDCHQK